MVSRGVDTDYKGIHIPKYEEDKSFLLNDSERNTASNVNFL